MQLSSTPTAAAATAAAAEPVRNGEHELEGGNSEPARARLAPEYSEEEVLRRLESKLKIFSFFFFTFLEDLSME